MIKFEKYQLVLNPPTQLRLPLQRSEYIGARDEFCKNKTKTALLSQYSMSFSGRHDKVVYILVSIQHRLVKDMYGIQYIYYVLYYNTGIWWRYENDIITKYSEYPENVYDNFSNENEEKKGKYIFRRDQI